MPTDPSPIDETPDVVLRPAGPEDLPAVAEVHLAARAAAVPLMPPGVHPPDDVRAWVAGWDLAACDVWVAEEPDRGRVVGYLQLTPTWLDGLYVAPEEQGRGIGRALLDLATSLRPGGFCLWVFATNTPARGLYRSAGLVELDETDGADNEERQPDVRMAWPGAQPLTFYRALIDEVDDQLGGLLARRVALTAAVQQIRPGGRDPSREAEVADRIARRVPVLGPRRTAAVVDAVITQSLDAAGRPDGPVPPR